MALKATAQRFGTTARQRNSKRTLAQQGAYIARTWGSGAFHTWQRILSDTGDLQAAYDAIRPYRFPRA